MERPNLLLILTDEQSSEAMSCRMGDQFIKTPAMDSLAARGELFDSAYCAHPLCVPSRASFMTGRYPHELGIMELYPYGKGSNRKQEHQLDHRRFPTIASHLRNAGYDTGTTGKWHIPLDVHDPAASGFNFAENILGESIHNGRVRLGHNGVDLRNVAVAREFLTRDRDRPFFLAVSFNNPHNICEWARNKMRDSLPDGDIGPPPPVAECPPLPPNLAHPEDEAEIVVQLRSESHRIRRAETLDEAEWRTMRWAYYRMIELVDRRLAQLFEILQETGQYENTAIVFTSDHGETCGAHSWHQKRVLYEESTKVPFIVCPAGGTAGKVSHSLIQAGIDLFPTLCGLGNVESPAELPGRNVLEAEAASREWIATATRFERKPELDPEERGVEGRMIRSRRYKYCVYDMGNHRESLFDLASDPLETRNLARVPSCRPVLEQHRRWFLEYASKNGDAFTAIPPQD